MKITLAKSNRGSAIGIIVAVILLLLALFLIIYLLLALLRLPVRALPKEGDELYSEYIFEPATSDSKWSEPQAPAGMRYRSVPLLTSTNLTTWEVVMCRVDASGVMHAPDGTVLRLDGEWSDELAQWVKLAPVVVCAGTNGAGMFRAP